MLTDPQNFWCNRNAPAFKKYGITDRELDVLELLATGMTNEEIAAALVVSVCTVKSHVHSLIRKLTSERRTGVVTRAFSLGILNRPDD